VLHKSVRVADLNLTADASGKYDLGAVISAALAQVDAAPDNSDIFESIRETQIARNHAIAEYNEIVAGLYSSAFLYTSDVNRVTGDRFAAILAHLLALPSTMARELAGMRRGDVAVSLRKRIAQITAELPEFVAADFIAKDVKEVAVQNNKVKSNEENEDDV
jgi:hypothetical protein